MENILVPIVLTQATKYIPWYFLFERLYKIFSKYEFVLKLIQFFKNFKYNNNNMIDRIRTSVYHLYLKQRLYFETKKEQREKIQKQKINSMKRDIKRMDNLHQEKKLFKLGFCKCETCHFFMTPDALVDKFKTKSFTEDSEVIDIKCFDCPRCVSVKFNSVLLSKYATKYGLPNTMDYIKEKKDKLVYQNMAVIKHENNVM